MKINWKEVREGYKIVFYVIAYFTITIGGFYILLMVPDTWGLAMLGIGVFLVINIPFICGVFKGYRKN